MQVKRGQKRLKLRVIREVEFSQKNYLSAYALKGIALVLQIGL